MLLNIIEILNCLISCTVIYRDVHLYRNRFSGLGKSSPMISVIKVKLPSTARAGMNIFMRAFIFWRSIFFYLQTNQTLLFKLFFSLIIFWICKFPTPPPSTTKKRKRKKRQPKTPKVSLAKTQKLWLLVNGEIYYVCYLIKMFLKMNESTLVL